MRPLLEVDAILSILRTSADRLRELREHAQDGQLEPAPYDAEWSMTAVLAHLLACNDVLGGNVLRIVREDRPAWRGMSPRTWQRKSGYHDWPFDRLFTALDRGRADLLAVVGTMSLADWERTATVTVPPKKVFDYSARYYGDWLAAHERAHLKHLTRTIHWKEDPA